MRSSHGSVMLVNHGLVIEWGHTVREISGEALEFSLQQAEHMAENS